MAAHLWSGATAVGGSLGGLTGITAYLTYRLKRRSDTMSANKSMVDAANSLTATALTLLEPVKAVAAEAEKKIHNLEQVIASLTTELASSEARSRAERQELERRLVEAEAERDRLIAELARRDTELNGMPRPAPGTV